MCEALQISGSSSSLKPPEEDQWSRFIDKLTSSPILWSQFVNKLTSSPSCAEVHWLEFFEKLVKTPPHLRQSDKKYVLTRHSHDIPPPLSPVSVLQSIDKLTSSPPRTAALWLEFVEKLVRTPHRSIVLIHHRDPHETIVVNRHRDDISPILCEFVENLETTPAEFDIIFVLAHHRYKALQHAVYMIDLNSSSNVDLNDPPSLNPIVKFYNIYRHEAYAIVGCKLYLLAGWYFGVDHEIKWINKVSIYDMREALASCTTIDLSDQDWKVCLETGPDMAIGKRWPLAVVIGFDICVFSTLLYEKKDKDGCTLFPTSYLFPNFELYDTQKGSWRALPEPRDFNEFEPDVSVHVDSYCVYGSSFIIKITLGMIYGIHLDNPNSDWVKMDGSEPIQKFPYNGMWIKVRDPCKVKEQQSVTARKEPTDRESLIEEYETGVLCLGAVNNGCINLCSVRGGLPYYGYIPNLLVDIVKFDPEALKKLRFDFSRWKEIQSVKSFNFTLSSMRSKDIDVLGCFPLKEIHTPKGYNQQYIKELKDIGFQWVDFANKVVALESGAHSLDFATSHTEGAKGNEYFERPQLAESHSTVTYGHAVGLASRL